MEKFTMTPLFPQIPDPTMLVVDGILQPHYSLFWRIIMDPWRDFLDRRAADKWFQDYTEADAAFLMHTHSKNHAKNLMHEENAIKILQIYGKPVYLIPEQLAVTIKKLRRVDEEEFFRSNYLTRRNTDYWGQRQMAGHLDVPRVIVGYVFLEEMTKLEIVVAYPRTTGLEVRWYYEMPAQSDTRLKIAENLDAAQGEPEKAFNILPKEGIILPDEDAEGA